MGQDRENVFFLRALSLNRKKFRLLLLLLLFFFLILLINMIFINIYL